jgi:hypothetical protein
MEAIRFGTRLNDTAPFLFTNPALYNIDRRERQVWRHAFSEQTLPSRHSGFSSIIARGWKIGERAVHWGAGKKME